MASTLDQWHDMLDRAAMTLDGQRSAQNFLLGSLATILDDHPEEAERVAGAMQRAIEYAMSLTSAEPDGDDRA